MTKDDEPWVMQKEVQVMAWVKCFKIRLDNVVLENKIWFRGYKYQDLRTFNLAQNLFYFVHMLYNNYCRVLSKAFAKSYKILQKTWNSCSWFQRYKFYHFGNLMFVSKALLFF